MNNFNLIKQENVLHAKWPFGVLRNARSLAKFLEILVRNLSGRFRPTEKMRSIFQYSSVVNLKQHGQKKQLPVQSSRIHSRRFISTAFQVQ